MNYCRIEFAEVLTTVVHEAAADALASSQFEVQHRPADHGARGLRLVLHRQQFVRRELLAHGAEVDGLPHTRDQVPYPPDLCLSHLSLSLSH